MIQRSFAVSAVAPTTSTLRPLSSSIPAVLRRTFTSTLPPSQASFVAVNHASAYEAAMQGPHGKQLALAKQEGVGQDLAPLDPFVEMDLDADQEEDDQEEEEEDDDDEEEDEEDDDDEDEDEDTTGLYNPDGSIRRKKSVLKTLRAGFPAGGQLAVFELGGTQFKVTTEDVIVVNRLKPVETYSIGSVHTLKDVLLVGSSHLTLVGLPLVQGAEVDVMVEEITRDAKVIIFQETSQEAFPTKEWVSTRCDITSCVGYSHASRISQSFHIGREIIDSLEEHFELQEAAAAASETEQKITRIPEPGKRQTSTTL